jgi:hypothetical protein
MHRVLPGVATAVDPGHLHAGVQRAHAVEVRIVGTPLHPRPAERTAVLLCNLGTPDEPTAPALRRYLAEFLGDHRVVEIPRWCGADPARHHPAHPAGQIGRQIRQRSGRPRARRWRCGRPSRPRCCAAGWASRAQRAGAPRHALRQPVDRQPAGRAQGRGRHPHPDPAAVPAILRHHHRQRVRRRLHLGAPARATCPSCALSTATTTTPATSTRWRARVRNALEAPRPARPAGDELSRRARAHLHLGDPYHCECHKTGRLLAERLGLRKDRYQITFQSRFGKAKWLEPYTEPTIEALGGKKPRHRACGRDLPRLHQRLPGNAGRNQHGSARGLPARGAARSSTTSLPERPGTAPESPARRSGPRSGSRPGGR